MEAGWGGHHPGAQHGLEGAATRLAPKSSVGEEMSVCEPAEAGRPAVLLAQASRDLPAPKEPSAREEGKSSDYSTHLVLVPLPWSKRQEGEGKRNLTPIIGRPKTLTMPHRPRPLTCPRVFSFPYRTSTLPDYPAVSEEALTWKHT